MVHPHSQGFQGDVGLIDGVAYERLCASCWHVDMLAIPDWFNRVLQWVIEGKISSIDYVVAKSWLIVTGIINATSTIIQ